MTSVRSAAGLALFDLPRWVGALSGLPGAWTRARNRGDELEVMPDGRGARVGGEWTSALHAAAVVPWLGSLLYRRAFGEHPIVLGDGAPSTREGGGVDVSVVIGHRGQERLPNLLMTLRSLAGQDDIALECLVVEQGPCREVEAALPPWVRYVHQEWPEARPFGRSHAFNLGTLHTRGSLLLLHDNDMLVPRDYVLNTVRAFEGGFDVVNLKRFVFYLTEADTVAAFANGEAPERPRFDAIVQNLLGGGSVAVSQAAYEELGGFDERFVGWGWEDNEFWERAQTLRVHSWGCLPILHLWHPAQPGKDLARATSESRAAEFRKVPVEKRIDQLRANRASAWTRGA